MRIKIIGECESARALRGLLHQAGFALTDFLPTGVLVHGPLAGYVVRIEESAAGGQICFDSVECELERAILRHITQLSPSPVVLDRPGGQVHSDREIRILVPAGMPGDAIAVEFGVMRGLADVLGDPKPKPFWKRFLQHVLGVRA